MAEIELFSYKKGDSRLHNTHPTLKILLMTLISFSLTYGEKYLLIYYLVLILSGFYSSKLSGLFKELKYIFFIALSLILFQTLVTKDFTTASIYNNVIYIARISEIILLGTLFTGTTEPADITPGLYNIIRSKRFSENISLTIRLIPTFLISWREIETTLNSRGLYLRKNPFYIMKYIAIPLLVETFKKADSISVAMESRCYNGWVKIEIKNSKIDYRIIALAVLPHLLLIKKLLPQG